MYSVLYEFQASQKALLDTAEGNGKGYLQESVKISLNGQMYNPYVYVAATSHIDVTLHPYDWYKRLVIEGALHHGFPAEYIASLEAIPSISDSDDQRVHAHEQLLTRMRSN